MVNRYKPGINDLMQLRKCRILGGLQGDLSSEKDIAPADEQYFDHVLSCLIKQSFFALFSRYKWGINPITNLPKMQ